ncbi:MAG: LysE family translocator [Pseudomonadota bacterium]
MHIDPAALVIFATALAVTAGSPGPSIAALVARVISEGPRAALPFLAAMWIGEGLWLTAAILGLVALAEQFALGFQIIKWLGVGYLCYLAWQIWTQPVAGNPDDAALPRRGSGWGMFFAGMGVTLGNPKIMLFYLALLPTLIDLGSITTIGWLELLAVMTLVLASVDLIWLAAAHQARRLLRSPRAMRIANRISAGLMGAAAAAIATRN